MIYLMEFIARVEDNRRQKKVEEDRVFEGDHALNHHAWAYSDNQAHNHTFDKHSSDTLRYRQI
jgi:hypothetical protein